MACTYRVSLYPCLILTYSLLPPITEYPDCQSLCPVVWIGFLHPITRKQVLLPPLWVQGGRVGEVVGGPNPGEFWDKIRNIFCPYITFWRSDRMSKKTSYATLSKNFPAKIYASPYHYKYCRASLKSLYKAKIPYFASVKKFSCIWRNRFYG